MAGVKSMLIQAADNDKKQTHKASGKAEKDKKTQQPSTEPIKDTSHKEDLQNSSHKKAEKSSEKKNLGGRPTNKEKGIKSRKQYTLTLKEDTYNLILEKAREDDLSFAKYMERAALDYINRHE